MDYECQYYDYDHYDALIFRDEKSYEECDTKVDMSWAEHNDPFFIEEWCILQKLMITNAVKEVKQYSYYPYKIFTKGSLSDVQRMVEDLNVSIREDSQKYAYKTYNGCSVKVLSFLWGSIDGKKDISGWERIHSGMIELISDGRHHTPLQSDPFSVNIIFPPFLKSDWIIFDSIIVPSKWQQLSCKDFTQGLRYNPFSDQVTTHIDWEY